MQINITIGRLFLAAAFIVFGIQQLIYKDFIATLMPVPADIAARQFLVYFTGVVLILLSGCIIINFKPGLASFILAIFFFLVFLVLHVPKIVPNVKDPRWWTAGFEILGMCGGALALGARYFTYSPGINKNRALNILNRSGGLFFAMALLVIGIQHFMYAEFIKGLIPSWIPGPLFWAYFVGVVLIATAISIVLNIKVRLSTTLSGIMFLLWVIILHTPRVISNLHNRDEWSSAFVALAFSGISFILSTGLNKQNNTVSPV